MRGLLKFLAIIGILVALFYARSAFIRSDIRAQSQEFVTSTLGVVTLNWNRAELDRHEDASLRAQLRALGKPYPLDFAAFAKLGPRKSELDCELGEYQRYKDETRNYIAANYSCSAAFERGSAIIYVNVQRDRDDRPWRIWYFDVVSPLLTPAPAKEQ